MVVNDLWQPRQMPFILLAPLAVSHPLPSCFLCCRGNLLRNLSSINIMYNGLNELSMNIFNCRQQLVESKLWKWLAKTRTANGHTQYTYRRACTHRSYERENNRYGQKHTILWSMTGMRSAAEKKSAKSNWPKTKFNIIYSHQKLVSHIIMLGAYRSEMSATSNTRKLAHK